MFDLRRIQDALREFGQEGWLLGDFRGTNPIARRILDLAQQPVGSRRFFYFIPADGEPEKLVHGIEPRALDHLPGARRVYVRAEEFEAGLGHLVRGRKRVAMEYSPRNAVPTISRVDAGTVELVRSFGVEVVPSGDLVQLFEATLDDDQWESHMQADRVTRSAYDVAWGLIARRARDGARVTEVEVQAAILDHFGRHGMVTYHPPTVAVGPHSGDPHYSPTPETDSEIRPGDLVLIDLWAKADRPRSIYSDLTRMGFVGEAVPARYAELFAVVLGARDAGIKAVRDAFAAGRPLRGWEVDAATRAVIEKAGHGNAFIHRTGHSLGEEVHGNGANIDNFETREDRLILRRTAFTIEPGLYFPEFGLRSEVDVLIGADGTVHVTGGPQTEVLAILG